MALKFDDVNGEAKKSDIKYFKFEDGENRFRMLGDVLARYVYWLKTPDKSKTLAVECLAFDRDLEKFTNVTKDWVNTYFPDEKCSWSYLVQVIDLDDGELKVLGLKKKLFQQILDMANKHHGDPTRTEEGWDCVVERKKTGPLAFNVEYTLDQLSSKPRALTDEEKELIADIKSIDTLFPLPTPEQQKQFLDKVFFSDPDQTEAEEVPDELSDTPSTDYDDDVPQ